MMGRLNKEQRDLGKVRKAWLLKNVQIERHFLVHKASSPTLRINFGVTLSKKIEKCSFYTKAY
jgi:hypothetical protein